MTASDSRTVRIFVNAVGVNVPAGASALDAIRVWSNEEADAVTRGDRIITDSRGLPIGGDVRVSAGSIFRLVAARKRAADASLDSDSSSDDA